MGHGAHRPLSIYRLPEGARWLIVHRDSRGEVHGSEMASRLGPDAVLLTINDDSGEEYYPDNAAYAKTISNPTIEDLKAKGLIDA